MSIYAFNGRKVRDVPLDAGGVSSVAWNGADESGALVASGVYFARDKGGRKLRLAVDR